MLLGISPELLFFWEEHDTNHTCSEAPCTSALTSHSFPLRRIKLSHEGFPCQVTRVWVLIWFSNGYFETFQSLLVVFLGNMNAIRVFPGDFLATVHENTGIAYKMAK